MDAPIIDHPDQPRTLLDVIDRHDENQNPEEAAETTSLKDATKEVLASLNDREARVLELRFGLEDNRQRTLEEVGKVLGVTRERIRQIEARALRKLRHPSRARKLRYFIKE